MRERGLSRFIFIGTSVRPRGPSRASIAVCAIDPMTDSSRRLLSTTTAGAGSLFTITFTHHPESEHVSVFALPPPGPSPGGRASTFRKTRSPRPPAATIPPPSRRPPPVFVAARRETRAVSTLQLRQARQVKAKRKVRRAQRRGRHQPNRGGQLHPRIPPERWARP